MKDPSTTRGELVLSAVRSDILRGELPPGSKLPFAMLIERYDASTGVLREVLPRLVEQGLVTSQPQLGYKVVSVSIPELEHLTAARIAFEGQILRQSIESGDTNWEGEVVAANHRLSRIPMYDGEQVSLAWLDEHSRFHRTLLAGCPNPMLCDLAERLRDLTQVYRCWSITASSDLGRLSDTEHRKLAEYTVARQADDAVRVLSEHMQHTADFLIRTQRAREEANAEAASASH
ncbi:FCD domain-containing protein [Streptomyces sp. NPDC050625]|uniref:GntR family transcriptional regulator n=1 Tax=Streptomyces sp. NPDC050625 TaxID=3154629 RepID=UPI00341540ED